MGRTSVATSLAAYFIQRQERVLVVQWALSDSISPLFSLPPIRLETASIPFKSSPEILIPWFPACSPSSQSLSFFSVTNFNTDKTIEEYFVDHLKMKLIHSLVIQNKHVQKLIHAAPGIAELFFLGRLFWLVELAQKEKGISYDRIIVDAPATGHGASLFGIAKAVANLGMTGPLALECERVASLISNPQKTGIIFVTLPEELPVEECIDFLPKVTEKCGYPPLAVCVNQSLSPNLFPQLQAFVSPSQELVYPPWLQSLSQEFQSADSSQELHLFLSALFKRHEYEKKLGSYLESLGIPQMSIPDFNLLFPQKSPLEVIQAMEAYFQGYGGALL